MQCGKNHGDRPCLVRQNVCFGCDKPGHKIYECPTRNPQSIPRPQRQGKVFTKDVEKAEKSEDLIQSACEVNGKTLTILYDSGALHFFISHRCVSALQLPIFELPYELLVSTPTNKPIKTSQVCVSISRRIEDRTFVANLICLPLCGLEIILGMDWLSANHVMLNCSEKTVVFPPVLSPKHVLL